MTRFADLPPLASLDESSIEYGIPTTRADPYPFPAPSLGPRPSRSPVSEVMLQQTQVSLSSPVYVPSRARLADGKKTIPNAGSAGHDRHPLLETLARKVGHSLDPRGAMWEAVFDQGLIRRDIQVADDTGSRQSGYRGRSSPLPNDSKLNTTSLTRRPGGSTLNSGSKLGLARTGVLPTRQESTLGCAEDREGP